MFSAAISAHPHKFQCLKHLSERSDGLLPPLGCIPYIMLSKGELLHLARLEVASRLLNLPCRVPQ
ncbi:MAG: hypothetical protein OEU26_25485, partial [Candidatus Tectomicrobia bacterium]|nr:hypothetical protein [Candidatus Tectomicrobia bacterium]